MAERKARRGRHPGDGLEGDFGPGFEPAPEAPDGARRDAGWAAPAGGIPCGREGCVLKPVGDLVGRFALELARRGHSDSAARAATSGIGFLRALRDFLDEEITFAERAAEARGSQSRYTKIPVE